MNFLLFVVFGYGVPLVIIVLAMLWLWLAGSTLGA